MPDAQRLRLSLAVQLVTTVLCPRPAPPAAACACTRGFLTPLTWYPRTVIAHIVAELYMEKKQVRNILTLMQRNNAVIGALQDVNITADAVDMASPDGSPVRANIDSMVTLDGEEEDWSGNDDSADEGDRGDAAIASGVPVLFTPQHSGPVRGLALYDYVPQGDEEIALIAGEVISEVETVDAEWWRGNAANRCGKDDRFDHIAHLLCWDLAAFEHRPICPWPLILPPQSPSPFFPSTHHHTHHARMHAHMSPPCLGIHEYKVSSRPHTATSFPGSPSTRCWRCTTTPPRTRMSFQLPPTAS